MNNKNIILDSNVWIYYFDKDSIFHKIAKEIINKYISDNYIIYITSQIIREVLVILTKENILENPLAPKQAIEKVESILEFTPVLFENNESNNKLKKIIKENDIKGLKIHDANIVAVALENNIDNIVTNNSDDFKFCKDGVIKQMKM